MLACAAVAALLPVGSDEAGIVGQQGAGDDAAAAMSRAGLVKMGAEKDEEEQEGDEQEAAAVMTAACSRSLPGNRQSAHGLFNVMALAKKSARRAALGIRYSGRAGGRRNLPHEQSQPNRESLSLLPIRFCRSVCSAKRVTTAGELLHCDLG